MENLWKPSRRRNQRRYGPAAGEFRTGGSTTTSRLAAKWADGDRPQQGQHACPTPEEA